MKYSHYSKINLHCLLIATSAIYMHLVWVPILFKLNLSNRNKLLNTAYSIIFIQYIMNIICRKKLQVLSFILLLESLNSYSTYKKYVYRYNMFFRKSMINNIIGINYLISDRYINVMAIMSLRIISLSIGMNGKRFLWLYLLKLKLRYS